MSFRCLICAHEAGRFLLRKQALVLARCERCDFIQQDPLPAAEEYDARYQHVDGYCSDTLRDKQLFCGATTACLRAWRAPQRRSFTISM